MSKHKEEKRRGSVLTTILLIAALAVFLFSAYKLITLYLEYRKASVEYDNVAQIAGMDNVGKINMIEAPEEVTTDPLGGLPEVNFEALRAVNTDVIAWLYFPEPKVINYPVVYSHDNIDYLHQTFEKTYNFAGSLFIDMHNYEDFSDPNVVIYGHAMNDGSMFGSLKKFRDEEYFNKNRYFYVFTAAGGVYRYEIFAAYETIDTSDTYQLGFEDADAFVSWLDYCQASSPFSADVALDANSRIVTLSTCTNVTDEGRFVVQGVQKDVLREADPARPAYWWSETEGE